MTVYVHVNSVVIHIIFRFSSHRVTVKGGTKHEQGFLVYVKGSLSRNTTLFIVDLKEVFRVIRVNFCIYNKNSSDFTIK